MDLKCGPDYQKYKFYDGFEFISEKHKKKFDHLLGLRGLINLGHTCFMNCIVQVLVHTPVLRDFVLKSVHQCDMKDCLVCEMFVTFREFYSGNPIPYAPSRLVYLTWRHAEHLKGYEQQDAHEFYIAILDILHKQWKDADETKYGISLIEEIFKGFFQSDIVCQECKHISTTYEPFLDICLNIGGTAIISEKGIRQHEVSLLDCISSYIEPEDLPSQCANCGCASRTKQLTVDVLPIVICFHLNRLDSLSRAKKRAHVNFPEFFDISPFMSSSHSNGPTVNENGSISTSENKYSLFAVVNHMGSRDGGHFTTYIKHHLDKWYKCNDHLITSANSEDVLASEGYLLFYHKV